MTDTSLLKRQVVHGVAWASATRMAGQALNWLMTLVVVRFLAPSDYGLMAITMAVTGFLVAMSYVGFSDVLVQSRDPDRDAAQAYGLILLVNFGCLAVLFALAPVLAGFYRDPRLTPLLRFASLTFVLLGVGSLSRARLQRDLALKQLSLVDMVSNVLGGGTTILLAWRGFGVWALLDGVVLAEVVRTAGILIMAPIRHWPALPTRRQGQLLRMGSYRTAENVLWYFGTQTDILIAGRMLGSGALGVYSLARTLASLPVDRLSAVVKPVALPAFSRLQDDADQALAYLGKSMRILALISFPIFLGVSAVSHDLVPAVLGARWNSVATPLAILAAAMTLRVTGIFLAPFLLGFGHFRASLVNTCVTTVLFGTAYGIGAHWGLHGICIAAAVVYPVVFLFLVNRLSVVRRGYSWVLLRPLLRPALAAALMYAIVVAVSWGLPDWMLPSGLLHTARLAVLVLTGAIAYPLLALLLCRDTVGEVVSMLNLGSWRWRRARAIRVAGE